MKRYLIIQLLFLCAIVPAMAQYYSVNYDTRTVAEMSAAFGTEAATEAYYAQQIAKIREHYQAAEVAAAGIFSSKFLDRRALTNLGLWTSATENYYYRRIYNMVSAKIMPKIWTVAGMMLKSPHNALYWGSYLYKICDEVKTLCYQFESIVTNSTLSFKDIVFLEINQELAAILKLSELGNVDWNVLLESFSNIGTNFTKENLKQDIDNLYAMGVSLASAGAGNAVSSILGNSSFNGTIMEKTSSVIDKLPVFCTFDRVAGLNYTKDKQGVRQQIKDNNGQELPKVSILKGEKSFPVFITTFTVVDKETKEKIKYDDYKLLSEEEKKGYNVYPKLQVYNVFNVHQTNLQEARPDLYKKLADEGKQIRPQSEGEEFSFAPLDRIIKDNGWICPIKPTYGDSAYYSISKNEIVVPEKKQFKDGESFYTNLGHEMAHSTGAENQLGRLQPTSFGSKEYAREELVAELSAALVAQRYGMTKHLKEDSASYLKSWLDSLNESPEFIKTTLTDVKKASSMITKCIDAMQQKIDQEQNIEAGQSKSQEPVYYASVAYLQMGEDTDRLDKLQEKGDYETLLKEAIEYDAGDAIDLSNTYLSPTKYRGDDLLVENEHYAVIYNPSVGGTYDVMRKVSAEEVRQNINRYGLPDNATADVKSIAEKPEHEMEAVVEEETHFHRGR